MTITINGSGTITGATTLASTVASPTMTTPTLTTPTMTGAIVSSMGSSVITSGTAVASTSGTSIDFTGIPSWVKRITVMFSGVSTNGTSGFMLQLGDAGGIETTGYVSGCGYVQQVNSGGATNSTTGMLQAYSVGASVLISGSTVLNLVGSNTWTNSGSVFTNTTYGYFFGSSKTLSDTLTQVRITTVNGTDTFDAGSINILYE